MEQLKTYALMIGLTLLFIWFGGMIAGQSGMVIAFLIASGMNFYAYYYSDQAVLSHYNAIPVDRAHASGLYEIVERLTQRAGLPMPKLYIIPEQQLEGVIAHELSHIKHYDMLIGTVTATIAGAIAMLAQFGMFFGGGDRDRPNPIVMIALMIIMPIVATLIQMTVSRSREFKADEGAARMTGHPEWLQSALAKLDNYARQMTMPEADPETAHMFIINPLTGRDFSMRELFSTHPSTEARIARLEELKHM